jgi:hypothetical protein
MKQIEVINLETIIDVSAETSNVEILVQDYDSELAERFALEAQEAAIDAEESADIATAQASIATAQAAIATTQAGIATTQAGNALTSANNAAASAQEAQDIVDSIITADLTEATSSVLTITGGTDAVLGTGTTIQVKQAGSSQSGFLSSTDWTTFNSKQNTITNPITGTGESSQVAFWNGTSSQTGDNGLFWDNTNKRLGVGTNAPVSPIQIGLTPNISLYSTADSFVATKQATSNSFSLITSTNTAAQRPVFLGLRTRGTLSSPTSVTTGDSLLSFLSGGYDGNARVFAAEINFLVESSVSSNSIPTLIELVTGSNSSNRAAKLQVRSNGNVIIQNGGTFTDAGFRLDVNGTARVQGELTVGNGTDSIIRANSSGSGSFQITTIQASAANTSTMIQIRPSGTNNSMTGFYLTDSATSALDTNVMLFGRGNATLPSTGVTYIGNIVSGRLSANSLHLGFLVSNTSLNRFEAARIWNSGNLYLQKGGTFTDVASAILNVNSTTQGVLFPRMTTTQKNAIASPATGLVVYDNTLNKLSVFTGLVWETLTSL